MTDRPIKIIENTTLALLGLVITAAFLFPVYSNEDRGILYKTIIAAAGFLFIARVKLLKTEDKIETPVDAQLFLLFIWYIISVIMAENKFASLNAAVCFFTLLLFFYIVYSQARKYSRYFTFFLVALASILCLYGLYQYFFGFDQTLKYLASHPMDHLQDIKARIDSRRVFSTLIYPNTFAGLLILVIPVAAGLFKNEKKYRPLFVIVLLLLFSNLLLTKSIGAFVSLIAAVLLVFFSISDASLRNFKTMLLIFLAAIIGLFIAVLRVRGIDQVVPDLAARLASWVKMLDLTGHYFLSGAGPGNFEAVYNSHGFKDTAYLKYAHNAVLQAAIELGLPGLIILLFAAFYGYRSILQNFYFTRTPQRKVIITSLLTGITAFLIHNLIDFDIYNFELCLIFLFALAILFSQVTIGLIEIKKIKLTYLLGINPGNRRSIVFAFLLAVLALSAVTGGKFAPVLSLIYIFITAGIAIWSVSKEDIRGTNLDIPIAGILLISIISLFYTPDLHEGIKYLSMIAGAAAVFYLFSQFLRRYTYKIIFSNFILFTGVVLCWVGLSQYAYHYFTRYASGPMMDCFFPNSDIFASYIVIPFGFLLGKLLFEKKINYLWPKVILLVAFIAVEALVNSRGGILQMGLVFCSMWAYYTYFRGSVKDTDARAAFKSRLMKILLITMLLAVFLPSSPSGGKILNIGENPFYFNRIDIYKAALKMGRDRLITGWGIGSFGKVFPAYNFPVNSIARYQMETPFAHNELLQIFAVFGIPGLAFFLFLIFNLFKNIPEREGHRKLWTATAGAYFGLAGVLFSCLFHFNLHVPGILFTCAVLAAMISKEKFAVRTIPREALFFTKIYYFPALIFAFIIFSFAARPALTWYLSLRYDSTKNYDDLSAAAAVDPLNPDFPFKIGLIFEGNSMFKEAYSMFTDSLRHDSLNYLTLLHAARASRGMGDNDTALNFYGRALNANPYRVFTMSEIGNFYYVELKDPAGAKKYFVRAVATEPCYIAARHSLAMLAAAAGEKRGALQEFDSIEEILSSNTPLTNYEKTLLDFPLDVLYFNKASLLKGMGNIAESCDYYRKSYALSRDKNVKNTINSMCGKGEK